MNKKECAVCGFNKKVDTHHIIKRLKGGSNDDENLICLCPNHHWIADFGTSKEREKILNIIKQKTGKNGKKIEQVEKEILDQKIRALEEETFCKFPGKFLPFSNEEWEEHKKTKNYLEIKSCLLSNPFSSQGKKKKYLLNKKAEILILIEKLKDELNAYA